MTNQFNFEDAVKALQSGKKLNGKDGVLTSLIKQLTESALQAELEHHLANEQAPNRKNGFSTKTIKSPAGNFELETPRDRSGSFEPQLIKKNQTTLSDEIDSKILSMFSMGMSYRDINKHIEDMYGMNVA
ncbi:transposase, partial [Pseudoalteromonas rhizosphaerae]